MKDAYNTLNAMLTANHILSATAEAIICYTLRFLQFESICDTLLTDEAEYIRWLTLSRQMQQPAELARRMINELCDCQMDEHSYELIAEWLLAFYRKKDTRIRYPQKIRTDLLRQQHHRCAICGCAITEKAELDHVIPWKYVGDELNENLQLLCLECNRSKQASPLYQLRMLLRKGEHWQQIAGSA